MSMLLKNIPWPLTLVLLLALMDTNIKATSKEISMNYNQAFTDSLYSKILSEERSYQVSLPVTYNDDRFYKRKYPVVFLLDGEKHFDYTKELLKQMSIGNRGNYQIPEMILVGINNPKPPQKKEASKSSLRKYQFNPSRMRDMTPSQSLKRINGKKSPHFKVSGGGQAFLQFVEQELIPKIENEYRADSYRTLIGHSLGGLAALSQFSNQGPKVFQSYIVLDPSIWWDDYLIESELSKRTDLKGDLYIAAASNKHLKEFTNRLKMLAEIISQKNSKDLRADFKLFEKEDHGSLPIQGIYYGLLHNFSGYKLDEPWVKYYTAKEISEHYQAFNLLHNSKLKAPEEFVNKLGYRMLAKKPTEAIELFKLNTENYPESFDAHDSLGEAFRVIGNEKSAKESLAKAESLKN